ncbi:MAG: hypothetical protein AAF826_09830, partial [Pseudomonadota bacterium]
AASANADETFEALMALCDDIDVIMLRNRLRLQIPRIPEEAATQAEEMMNQGMATCGEGDLDGAKTTLTAALDIADKGASDAFGAEGTVTATASATTEIEATSEGDAENAKPWWQFW